MAIKTILISHIPLPYHKIGSWTTLYDNYILNNDRIDFIICPKPIKKYEDLSYAYFKNYESLLDKLKRRIHLQKKWKPVLKALESILKDDNDKYVVQIVDNYGLGIAINDFLEHNNLRKNCYVLFFYHGYKVFANESLYSKVDEVVLLTHKSYREVLNNANVFPCYFSILHNGIDTSKFYSASSLQKDKLKKQFDVQDKKIFLWCSQDRPKKGLDFILNVWKVLGEKVEDCELFIVGATRIKEENGVRFLGQIPNDELPKYYQIADVYLFPTLCQEGFGMSLIEALHCGCYCIASSLGGVPEVLGYGAYGKLIEDPHFTNQWVNAILDYLNNNYEYNKLPKNKYSANEWNRSMNSLIETAKKRLL